MQVAGSWFHSIPCRCLPPVEPWASPSASQYSFCGQGLHFPLQSLPGFTGTCPCTGSVLPLVRPCHFSLSQANPIPVPVPIVSPMAASPRTPAAPPKAGPIIGIAGRKKSSPRGSTLASGFCPAYPYMLGPLPSSAVSPSGSGCRYLPSVAS